jgi:6-phosphogluconolactonase
MLYVSCGETLEILHFAMDCRTGALARCGTTRLPGAPTPAAPVAAVPQPSLRSNGAPLTVSPDGSVLYAAMRAPTARVVSYRIDRGTGALSPIGEAPIPDLTPYVATDRTGRYLLGASYVENLVWVSRTGPEGAVIEAPFQKVAGLTTAHCVKLHPGNRIVYAGATGAGRVQIFAFDPETGRLGERRAATGTSLDEAPTPRHLAISPDARFLYCINETSGIVDAFAIGAEGGALELVHSVDPRPAEHRQKPGIGADIKVSGDGRFLYCSERVRGTISIYAIDAVSGRLSHAGAVAVGSIPRSFALEPAGRFLVAAAQGEGAIHVFAIDDRDGSLTRWASYPTGGTPIWVEFVELAVETQSDAR